MTANDALFVAGTAAVLVGVWLYSPPFALIAGGLVIGSVGVLRHLSERRRKGPGETGQLKRGE